MWILNIFALKKTCLLIVYFQRSVEIYLFKVIPQNMYIHFLSPFFSWPIVFTYTYTQKK